MDIILNMFNTWASTIFTAVLFVFFYFAASKLLKRQSKGLTDKKLINSLILFSIAFIGAISVVLAIPMDTDQKGQVTSLIGIVLSAVLGLSATTFIGNAIAGIALKMRKDFKPGDFIKVNEIFGRVTEQGLFHTEVQTPNRDLTSMPNMMLASNPVNITRSTGTILAVEVSLGYDVNRLKIEESLIKAGLRSGLKEPFVLITSLGDFSIVYKLNGLLENVKSIVTAKSVLTGHVIDVLHEDGIEIVSPNFMNQRQVGETVFIPKKHKLKDPNMSNNTAASDSIIFDKADEAESIEKRKELLTEIEAKVKTEKELLKNATDEEAKAKIKTKLDTTIALKEKLQKKIDEKVEKLADS
jgi:small-conductance mechanosensitive channel